MLILWLSFLAIVARAATLGPPNSNSLWYTSPGSADTWSLSALPISNGYVSALTIGNPIGNDSIPLNLESAWSGGPFQPGINYTGGNPTTAVNQSVWKGYRDAIWESENGTIPEIDGLMEEIIGYGSFAGLGSLDIIQAGSNHTADEYVRWLDLEAGVSGVQWSQTGKEYTREYLCSNPSKVCIVHQQAQASSTSTTGDIATGLAYSIFFTPIAPSVTNITCLPASKAGASVPTLLIRGVVPADPITSTGMIYELQARVHTTPPNLATCSTQTSESNTTSAVLSIPSNAQSFSLLFSGNTDYSLDASDAAHGFSYKGADPHAWVERVLDSTEPKAQTDAEKIYTSLRQGHDKDYAAFNDFRLVLGDSTTGNAGSIPTDEEVNNYVYNVGNRHLEVLLFTYGRYLLFTSSRSVLPANLQGKWGPPVENAWSGDYHSNINIQMNYWSALTTFPSTPGLQEPLFEFIKKNWASRGAVTAEIVYGIERGWVAHSTMNVFGYTGMSLGDPEWADYPQSAVWMMLHVWDQFDYLLDKEWFTSVGWPLLKGVAQFHLDLLIEDGKFKDGTLVTAPCNSPEQAPTTFGCSHAQQLTYQLFNAIEKGYPLSGDDDASFLNEVKETKAKLWKGIKIGSWGQFQEWKMDLDSPTDTHRHLSHLIGLYPGYALTGYTDAAPIANYTRKEVLDAVTVSLIARGNGTGPDADSGWEKMWRAACWAQLSNADKFFFELSYGIALNYGPNLFSQYSPGSTTFQIDANLALPAAVMNALVQAPDTPSFSDALNVTLLPALPTQWAEGSITNTRLRGGIVMNMTWTGGKLTSATILVDRDPLVSRKVNVFYGGEVISSFTATKGFRRTVGK